MPGDEEEEDFSVGHRKGMKDLVVGKEKKPPKVTRMKRKARKKEELMSVHTHSTNTRATHAHTRTAAQVLTPLLIIHPHMHNYTHEYTYPVLAPVLVCHDLFLPQPHYSIFVHRPVEEEELCVCVSVCLSVCLFVCLSVCLSCSSSDGLQVAYLVASEFFEQGDRKRSDLQLEPIVSCS